MSTPRVAVVGGGAAGLTAALALRANGIDVVVLEGTATAGGLIRTVRRDGWIAEAGPNSLAEPDAAIRTLLDGAGLAGRTLRADVRHNRRFLVHRGTLVPVPKSVGELLAWPILSAGGRMRLLKEPFIRPGEPHEEESVDAFVRRRLGEEMATQVFDPLVGASCAGDPKSVLMRYAFPRLVEWEQRGGSLLKGSMRAGMEARRKAGKGGGAQAGLWSCPAGLAEIPERITTALGSALRTGVRVRRIAPTRHGFQLVASDGATEGFSAVISAVPARGYLDLELDGAGAAVLGEVASVPHASLASVSLGFRRDQVTHDLDGHGLLTPSCERRQLLGTLFVSSLFAGRAPEGHVLLTSFLGGATQQAALQQPDAALLDIVRNELSDLLGIHGAPCFAEVARWPTSQPQAVAGHGRRLAAVAALEGSIPGLAFAGAWHDGLSLADAMRSGLAAAMRVGAHLRAPSPS